MAGKRVAVLAPDGTFGTVDESEVEQMPEGSRVLSSKELAKRAVDEAYDRQSTAQKIVGTAAGPTASQLANPTATALTGRAPDVPISATPEAEAFSRGGLEPFTFGAERVGIKKATEALAGKEAAQTYVQHSQDVDEGYAGYKTGGNIAGFAAQAGMGGGLGAAKAVPGLGVSALGGAVEGGVARALGGIASRGALGRAATTGASLAARGAVEGGIYAGATQATENVLNEAPVGEKLYGAIGHGMITGGALGGVLGFSGSLAASGARGLKGKALELAAGGVKAEEAAIPALSAEATEAGSAFAKPKAMTAKSVLAAPDDAARRLSNQLAVDALYATKTQARDALEHVAGGADAVGEYVNRIAIKPAGDGAGLMAGSMKAGAVGRADQLLETIQKDKALRIAPALSDAIKSTPARFPLSKLEAETNALYTDMMRDPARISGAEAFRNRVQLETSALRNTPGRVAADGSIDATDAFYTRAALEKGAYEVTRASTPAGAAYKQLMRKWDSAILDTIDEAATKAGKSGTRDQIKHWKREWQLASSAEEMATGGAERATRNNIFGIREGIGAAAGIAMGHPIMGALTLVGGKLARERGSAAGAYALGHLADSGAIGRAVQRLNGKVSGAAKAIVQTAPAELPGKTTKATSATQAANVAETVANKEDVALTHKKALEIMKWMSAIRANPDRVMSQLEEAGAIVGHTAGSKAAQGYTSTTLQAINFIAGHIPAKERRDPLDPRSVPPLTYDEADRLVRATTYATQPEKVWDDFAKLKVTPEGLRAAKTFQPTSFAEFQEQLQSHVEDHLLRNRQLTQTQRLQIDKLLGYGMTPKRSAIARLQANLMPVSEGPPPAASPSGAPLNLKVQQTGFDAVEARRSAG